MSELVELPDSLARQSTGVAGADRKRRLLRVWMVDDHGSFREGFAQLLNATPGFKVTRQFSSTAPLLAALADERPPDLVLLDLNIGKESGLSVIQPAKKLAPTIKVVMLTTFNNTYAEAEAFRAGASGFLLKIYDLQEIVRLIHQAFYSPADPRLFPNLASARQQPCLASPKQVPVADERTGFFSTLRHLCRPRRQKAAH
jgi:DNA-binding NarL/FixJ family response regulator